MKTLTTLLSSKKFLVAALAAVSAVVAAVSGALPWDQAILAVLGAAAVYVGAQGAADVGKSAAIVRAEASKEVAAATAGKAPAEAAAALEALPG